MSNAHSIGGAANARSLEPHKYMDPLDFISKFVLDSANPQAVLHFIFFALNTHADQMLHCPAVTIEELEEDDKCNFEKYSSAQERHKEAAMRFIQMYNDEYPQQDEDKLVNDNKQEDTK